MKYSLATIFAVLMLALAFTGCKKDDDPKSKENLLQVGDTVITIKSGSLINYGQADYHEGFNLDLNLFGEGVTMTEVEPGIRYIEGNGLRFYCEMFTSNEESLVPGTYVLNDTSEVSPVRSFDWMDYTFTSANGGWIICTEGTIKVSKSGDIYELIITAKDENDDEISGYYKGPLQYFIDDDAVAK